jgi:hypothetical protein
MEAMSELENRTARRVGNAVHLRLYLIGAVILVAGLLVGLSIYATADDNIDGAISYEIIDGKLYPTMPDDTKQYVGALEHVGGKTAVLAADLDNWFSSLWHGKKLGKTIALLSAGIAFGCFVFARLLSALQMQQASAGKGEGNNK